MEHIEMPADSGAIAEDVQETDKEESFRQAAAVINILARAKRYRSGKNAKGLGKTIGGILHWGLPLAFWPMLFTLTMRFVFSSWFDGHRSGFWLWAYWATEAAGYVGVASGVFVVVSAFFLLWRRRAELPDNEAHHANAGYLLHETQVRSLAVYPLSVLQSVGRFYEQRPLALQGIQAVLSGKSPLSWASAALVLAMVKQLYDMHAFAVSSNDFLFFLWLCLWMLLYISTVVWWFRLKEDYQRALLADAIELVSSRTREADRERPDKDGSAGLG